MIPNNSAFGRKVVLTIYTPDGSFGRQFVTSMLEGKQGLKITGTIKKFFSYELPQATVNIYNLSAIEVGNILNAKYKIVDGKTVEQPLRLKIEAGYIHGNFGQIFDGEILKPNMLKPDPNNTQLRLTCIDGADFVSAGSTLTQTFNDGINYYSIAQQIKDNSDVDYSLVLSDTLKQRRVDGSFVTGTTDYLTYQALAQETGTVLTVKDKTVYLQTMEDLAKSEQPATVLNSRTGLIGIPALSSDGVTIQSVLNPKIDVLSMIQLNNADISINQPEYLQNRSLGAWLSSDGLYRVIELTHNFDTTTGAFTTDCRCFARDYLKKLET